jgi:hypothetical protein
MCVHFYAGGQKRNQTANATEARAATQLPHTLAYTASGEAPSLRRYFKYLNICYLPDDAGPMAMSSPSSRLSSAVSVAA